MIRLFCLPYAGGSAAVFRAWSHDLPPEIEVNLVKLPGRESRVNEPPMSSLTTLVQALGQALQPYLNRPFALFGHSMGALISFELARHLAQTYGQSPTRLLVSGFRAPHLPDPEPPIYHLPEAEFVEEIRRFNGTPEAVLQNAELMELMLPILRADFTITETYTYTDAPPLDCPISAFGGLQDGVVSQEHIDPWSIHTRGDFALHMFPGNHFFLHSARPLLLWSIAQELTQPHLSHRMNSASETGKHVQTCSGKNSQELT
jgi:medium-chain acyl-[acyl-carrier-protein] hydrolase